MTARATEIFLGAFTRVSRVTQIKNGGEQSNGTENRRLHTADFLSCFKRDKAEFPTVLLALSELR